MTGPTSRQYSWDRYELKYFIPEDWIEDIKKDLAGYVQYDPFSAAAPDRKYAVRSIYFDNDTLDFYYEKLDGLRIRKKLRVRTYGDGGGEPVYFLEIKRRYSEVIYKERARISPDLLLPYVFGRQSFNGEVYCDTGLKRLLQKFSYNLEFRDLRPTALVVYNREALIGLDNPRIRITFDTNLSTHPFPGFDDFYTPRLIPVTSVQKAILEIKFDQYMPGWLRNIVKKYALYRQAISKYCLCIDEIRQTGLLAGYSKNGNGVKKEWKTSY
jgi:hypothetical protein